MASLLLNFRRKYTKRKNEYGIFAAMLALNLFQCIMETVTLLLDGRQFVGARACAVIANTLTYIGNIVFTVTWVVYADLRVRKCRREKYKKYRWVLAPAVALLAMILLNLFVPILFYITPENIYQRGILFPVSVVITYCYLIYGVIVAYGVRRKQDKYVFLPAFLFLAPVFLASILQFIFVGYSLLWVGSAVGLVSVYMSLLDERVAIDGLSGVFGRHYLNTYLEDLCKKAEGDGLLDKKHRISGVMMDVDRFKQINDTYGHLEGDEVISGVGEVLKKSLAGEGTVFRYAGDEFVIIFIDKTKDEVDDLLAQARIRKVQYFESLNKEYEVNFSIGYAEHRPGETAAQFIMRMDNAMYIEKNRHRMKD